MNKYLHASTPEQEITEPLAVFQPTIEERYGINTLNISAEFMENGGEGMCVW